MMAAPIVGESKMNLLSASELKPLLASGRLSSTALARACLERVRERDDDVRAWSYIDPDTVLAQARALDECSHRGPLHGIPVGIKDVLLTGDMPTQYNSPIYQGYHPRIDAAAVATLRAAGALIFGKTDTVEFAANGRSAATRNPHDLARTPGGSSSGSAAAVADFHVPLTLGTQTGGSIIRPASYCGVYGFKPTWGLVSREGAKMFAATFDTVGWFARSAADLSLLLEVFEARQDDAAPFVLAGARIALCASPMWEDADADTRAAWDEAQHLLRAAGAVVIDLALPSQFGALPAAHTVIMRSEARASFLAEYRGHFAQLHDNFRAQVDNAAGFTRQQLCDAYDAAAACRRQFDRIAGQFDAVLTPSTVGCAPVGLSNTGPATFNSMWSLLHVPIVNVPGLQSAAGLPIGLSVTGPRFTDARVLAAASAIGAVFAAQGERTRDERSKSFIE